MNNIMFLGGLGEPGMPIESVPTSLPITVPSLSKFNFNPPGFEQRPPSVFGPREIQRRPNALEIQSPTALRTESVSPMARLLNDVRPAVNKIYAALQELPTAKDREIAIKATLEAIRPGGAERINTMTYKFIAAGMPASAAFREALARELAATLVTGVTRDEAIQGLNGLGNFLEDAYDGVKNVVKKGAKYVKKGVAAVAGAVAGVACSSVVTDGAGLVSSAFGNGRQAGRRATGSVCEQANMVKNFVEPPKKNAPTTTASQNLTASKPKSPPPQVSAWGVLAVLKVYEDGKLYIADAYRRNPDKDLNYYKDVIDSFIENVRPQALNGRPQSFPAGEVEKTRKIMLDELLRIAPRLKINPETLDLFKRVINKAKTSAPKKEESNTGLYVLGGAVLLGGAYLATRKKGA